MQPCSPYKPLEDMRKSLQFIIAHKQERGEDLSTCSKELLSNFQGRAYQIYMLIGDKKARGIYYSICGIVQNILAPQGVFPIALDSLRIIANHLSISDLLNFKEVTRKAKQVAYEILKLKIISLGYIGSGSIELFLKDLKRQFFSAINLRLLPYSVYAWKRKRFSFDRVCNNFYYSNLAKIHFLSTGKIFIDSFKLMRQLIVADSSLPRFVIKKTTVIDVILQEEINLLRFIIKAFQFITGKNAPIHYAVQSWHRPVLKCFLDEDPSLINQRGLYGATPLCFACGFCEPDPGGLPIHLVKLLLSKGAEPNIAVKDKVVGQRRYPLHFAVAIGREDIVKHLLKCNADFLLTDSNGDTPLSLAQKLKRQNIVDLMLKFDKN